MYKSWKQMKETYNIEELPLILDFQPKFKRDLLGQWIYPEVDNKMG